MPGPPTSELAARTKELTERLDSVLERLAAIEKLTEFRLNTLEGQVKDHGATSKETDDALHELTAKVAALEERCRYVEKLFEEKTKALQQLSDRGWGFGQAALITIISLLGTAVFTLIIQLTIKK